MQNMSFYRQMYKFASLNQRLTFAAGAPTVDEEVNQGGYMTQTAIVCLAICLLLIAGTLMAWIPAFITAIALGVEAIFILAGSRLTS